MKKWCVLIAGFVLIGALMTGCNKETTVEPRSITKEMYLNKTEYVGDNSKVLALVGLQTLPENLVRKETRLETLNSPYGVVVSYEFEDKKNLFVEDQFETQVWIKNAILLLSLIENADFITYEFYKKGLDSQGLECKFTYTRDEANKAMGADILTLNNSETAFFSFYEEVIKGNF